MIGGLHRQLRQAYARAGMLYELHLDLLYQCDLDCEHCYLDDKSRRILTTAFWTDVIDQAAALQVASVLISGGEIFLRKDLLDIVAHARSHGLFVNLKSHGGAIDEAIARRLYDLGVSTVWLSYYASDPAIHDAITRRPGSHARTRAAIERLARAGIVTVASIAVMQRNRAQWREAVDEVRALGALASVDGQLRAAHSGDPFPKALRAQLDDLVGLEAFHADHEHEACDPEAPAARPAWEDQKECAAGHLALYVGPEGELTPCVAWPMPLGNLARGDRLADLWRASPALQRIQAYRKVDRVLCASCPVREDCDFCMGQAWVETGDPRAAITNLCWTTRAKTLARAAARGLPEPPMPAGLVDGAPAAPARRFPIRVVAPDPRP
ncbi:MAG: radical SAM protein [Deltaproteobacteria bacterium]|nr:radical SAM protein [Deltaproteobacteria bacterium]